MYVQVVIRSAVNGPDSSRGLRCQNTKVNRIPHHVTLNWHWTNQPCTRP